MNLKVRELSDSKLLASFERSFDREIFSMRLLHLDISLLQFLTKFKQQQKYLHLRSGANSYKAVSDISSNQLLIKMPLSGYSLKFSATLSTIIVFSSLRPIRLRSFMKTIPVGDAC